MLHAGKNRFSSVLNVGQGTLPDGFNHSMEYQSITFKKIK